MPLLRRLEILLFGLSGDWSIGDCLLRLVLVLIGLCLFRSFSLAGGDLLLQPSAIVAELSLQVQDQVFVEWQRFEMALALDQSP